MDVTDLPIVPDEDTTLPAGARLGKYQVVRLLGAGGMGAVYEAFHTEIGKRVAVKTLAPALAAIRGARQRFLREAQLTSRLRHPHIVDLTDMGTEGRIAYLVMELLAGEDLAHRLERTGPMVPRDLVDLMLPVCSALIEAHAAGIVHRDLKPQNIFLATGHHGVAPKVLDFGISKSSDTDVSGLTSTGSVIGTPHYLAPEQIKDARSASAASDQYSLGVIFYKCLTDKNPFEGESIFAVLQAIVTEKPVPVGERRAGLPDGLDRVVSRAMSPLPWERFASVRELGRALLPYASNKARVIWEETFTAAHPSPEAPPEVPRESRTMPMPTSERPVRLASEVPTAKAARIDSGTLSPAVSSSTSLGLETSVSPKRGRMVVGTLLGAALAVGAGVLFTHARTPQAPPAAAAPAPRAAAPVVAAPPAPSAEVQLREARAAEAKARETQEKAAGEKAAAERAAQARAAEAAEAAKRATEAKAAEAAATRSARRHTSSSPSSPSHHGAPRAHPETPTPAVPARSLNPNGAPVID